MHNTTERFSISALLAISGLLLVPLAVPSSAVEAENTTAEIEVPLPLETFTVQADDVGLARFTGGDLGGEPGLPGLPSIVFRVLLPPNADLRSAQAQLEKTEIEDTTGKWDVPPYPPAAHVGGQPVWPKGVEIQEGRNVQAYSTNAFQPPSFLGLVKGHPVREWKVLLVRINPFRHNPVTQQLQRLRAATLVVSFKTVPAGAQAPSVIPAHTRQRMRESIINFDAAADQYK